MFRLGIERISEFKEVLQDKRLGMITSASGTDQRLRASVDVLREKHSLCALYGPEHGVRGAAEAGELVEGVDQDRRTGLPVYSLYRKESKRLTAQMAEGVDAFVYDIQDLGLRFYTYVSTLLHALEDCARLGKELIVLDRPNPLGGLCMEGGLLRAGFESFVGSYPMPVRYGLTPGEFAMMANAEKKLGCALTVIPMTGWRREALFPELGYPFLMPSPSIPNFHNALAYAGTCLLEGTNASEGRGTADPFKLIGAPYADADELCAALQEKRIPGLLVTPAHFIPTSSKHKERSCQGVHLHITDAKRYPAVRAGVELICLLRELYPKEFSFNPPTEVGEPPMMDLLSGSAALREGADRDCLLSGWEAESAAFARRASAYHLY